MQWQEGSEGQRITKASSLVEDARCVVTWQWPKDIQYVYIYSFASGEEDPPEGLTARELKLYTREEYKVHGGYRVPADFTGARCFRIFPCVMGAGGLTPVRQLDAGNLTRLSGSRAKIRCSVEYGASLFSRHRPVRIRLFCEVPVPREALCYVKKEGGVPLNKDDGTVYPLVSDLPAGRTDLPEIRIGRSERIRIFFTDGPKYGELFEIVPE
ncbi:hypothetical protein [Paenibacillus mucilaginosus]|uniref:Beta-mannanase n=2 Tax=Paenibacillus mucilaginosus TaxID=61624 RepID=H6N903_9BACL|nr:hypothetical protein [Paenibacillus mucilaginosus]AEI39495.1 hypothetical protein KNP414_00905 [Paenibacillus mucilaginosus KNP414]AFC27749.1 hypothetical protein PM3016_797 [Paenibacillus mucilaginosus 3016]MCG7214682.1 hypothetical protein [Paenibacillus mucilaginosus]WDM28458.1 hypothetical protein KCX80_04225 [Paenibacillus mucilaginosus]WFA16623.1 hypothetical protein ERY13_04235 [Paenibacillus mucilaginosus]